MVDPVVTAGSAASPFFPEGGLLLRAKVVEIQNWIRRYVGERVRISLEWSRTGVQNFALVGGDRTTWTTEAIFGRRGEFRAVAPGSMLSINDLRLGYTVEGTDILWDSHFRQVNGAAWLTPAIPTVGTGEPGNVVGAIGLMGLVSILSFAWQLMHPEVSLTLPGDLACDAILDGDQLTIEVKTPRPIVAIRVIAKFQAALSVISANPDRIGFDFVGSAILKHREIAIA